MNLDAVCVALATTQAPLENCTLLGFHLAFLVPLDIDRGPPPGDATSGSARTDYHSNHMLSSRAKLRQQLIRGDATLEQAKDGMQDAWLCRMPGSAGCLALQDAWLILTEIQFMTETALFS